MKAFFTKKLFSPIAVLLITALCIAATVFTITYKAPDPPISVDELFRVSVTDAMTIEPEEILPLLPLTKDSELTSWDSHGNVLLVTWNDDPQRYPSGETIKLEGGEVWTFTDKEIAEWYRQNKDSVADWDLRFKQLIGLPPDAAYTHFTALWVNPDDVLRPAYCQNITDASMTAEFGGETDAWFAEWFDANILYSYFESAYPWTRLGYTYDWGDNGTEYGLSEFIILPDSTVEVEFTMTTEEFLSWLEAQID